MDRARWRQRLDGAAIVFCLVAPLAAVLAVCIPPEPEVPADSRQALRQLVEADLDDEGRLLVLRSLRSSPADVDLIHDLLAVYFESLRTPPDSSTESTDHRIQQLFERRRSTTDGLDRDAASFALGEYCRHLDDKYKALEYYASVRERDLPHLNASEGAVQLRLGEWEVAGTLLRREIALGHDVAEAVAGMGRLGVLQRDWQGLGALLSDPALSRYVPLGAERALRLHERRLVPYLRVLFRSQTGSWTWTATLIALYGCLLWFLLVRWWDVFQKEPVILSIAVVLLGGAATSLLYLMADVRALQGSVGFPRHDPIAWILHVGMPEEAVKFLPLLFVRLFTRAIDEPVDWMIYACLAALGFSVVENCDYIATAGLHVSAARIFGTTAGHVAYTGFLALCIPIARQRGRSVAGALVLGFLVVSTVHGMFDFLVTRHRAPSSLFALSIDLGCIVAVMRLMGWVHGMSPYRGRRLELAISCTRWVVAAYVLLCIVVLLLDAPHLQHVQACEAFGQDLGALMIFSFFALAYTRLRIRRAE